MKDFAEIFRVLFAAVLFASPSTAQPFESSATWLQGFDDWISELSQVKATDFQWSVGAGAGTSPDFPGGDN